MPINQSIWNIDNNIEELKEITLNSENELEEILSKKIELLNERWLVIGRQVPTDYNKKIDLLALDDFGNLIILELKKSKTPRDVIAQGLDYAAWVRKLLAVDIEKIFHEYQDKYLNVGNKQTLNSSLKEKFNILLQEDEINNSHQIIIIASELDSQTERIVNYLSDSEIPINIVFFKVFNVAGTRIISRAWLIEPEETAENVSNKISDLKNSIPWNNEFYVSFGVGDTRSWSDARNYGFISGGGKSWYSRTLNLLQEKDRVWINIPHTGYVAVGIVTQKSQMAKDVLFDINGEKKNIYELSPNASYHKEFMDDEENSEYIVKVDWIKAISEKEAVKELGFFGNQNTVCKPGNSKWLFTIEQLMERWNIQ